MTRQLPRAAVRVMRDALDEAKAAGVTDPSAAAQHVASALITNGWYVTALPRLTTHHRPEER